MFDLLSRHFISLFSLVSLFTSSSFGADTTFSDFLNLRFGVEQYEGNKKIDTVLELWELDCESKPDRSNDCQLRREVFWDCVGNQAVVDVLHHSTSGKTLSINTLDLKKGQLDFIVNFISFGKQSGTCSLTFDKNKEVAKDLRCATPAKNGDGKIVLVENRIVSKSFYYKPKCGFLVPGQTGLAELLSGK